jgi:hypothetical protein
MLYGHFVYSMAICNVILYILWPIGYFVEIWYIFTRFGIIDKGKSVNPDVESFFNFWNLTFWRHRFIVWAPHNASTALHTLLFNLKRRNVLKNQPEYSCALVASYPGGIRINDPRFLPHWSSHFFGNRLFIHFSTV